MRLDIPDELVYWFNVADFRSYSHVEGSTFAVGAWWLVISNAADTYRGLWTADYPGSVTPGMNMHISTTFRPKLETGSAVALALWYDANNQLISADEIGRVDGSPEYAIGETVRLTAPWGAVRLRVDFRLWNAVGSCRAYQFSVWPEVRIDK